MPGALHVHSEFVSIHIGGGRTVIVYTPPGYARDTRRRYPLLLLHDGQNVFDPATAYVPGQYWQAKEVADDLLLRRRIEPVVIAAVYHGAEKRLYEYTPTKTRRLDGGGAESHGRMIVEELLPWLRHHYRLLPHARHTGVGGSSLGGLVSLWLGLTYPQVFGKLALLSPSVWWDRRQILRCVEKIRHPQRQRVWLDIGSDEGDEPFPSIRDVRLLKAMLVTRGWREGRNLHYFEVDGGRHSESYWATRFPQVLEFLYPRKAAK